MELTKLVKILNKEFGEPFLPKGHVRARINDDGDFILHIGRRDIQYRDDGTCIGTGTVIDPPVEIPPPNKPGTKSI